ncbi:MAG TPA: hypothetical protein VIT88_14485 [Pyrinomonadaceae bacterium]
MERVLSAIIIWTVLGCGFGPVNCLAQNSSRIPTLNKQQWREDLQYFAMELPKRHKNLFHTVSREQFERAVADLDTAIPSLQYHQIVVRMLQITASVGDGHTGVHVPPYFKLLPLALYWFGSELRVTSTQKEYERALGARVVKIGAFSIGDVQARIRRCLPSAENENEWYVMGSSPSFITRPEILHALGVVPDHERVPFTFEDDQGEQFTLEIFPFAPPPAVKGAIAIPGALPAAKVQPLFRQKPAESFWFTHLPDSQTTYVNFRRYDSLGEHSRALFAFIDRHQPKRLVIDLRQNGGGDFFEGRKHLIRPIKERPALNQKGRLFVIVGRRTYSAAMANAIDFRKETNATLVGEPIGERPNSYSENDEMTLPNSRLVVSYSTRYYKFLDEDVPAVMPDKRIDPNWPDFKAGRDAVMDWILSQNY